MVDMSSAVHGLDIYLYIQEYVCNMKDPYDRGVYNGLELARSLLTGEEPVFMQESGELDKEAMQNNPQRYI